MQERGDRKENTNQPESILTPEQVEEILEKARTNLERHGHLVSTLFLHLTSGEKVLTELSLPCIHEEKQAYFTFLGKAIRYSGYEIREAILLSESWVVMAPQAEGLGVSPSQHPNRQEAITLVGRNAPNNRSIFAIQTFHRDHRNQPVFEALELEQFTGLPDSKYCATGLLDYLFPAEKRILH